MKRILPYILILMILVNIFAPFSIGVSDNKIAVEKNTALAFDKVVALTGQNKGMADDAKNACLVNAPGPTATKFCFKP